MRKKNDNNKNEDSNKDIEESKMDSKRIWKKKAVSETTFVIKHQCWSHLSET